MKEKNMCKKFRDSAWINCKIYVLRKISVITMEKQNVIAAKRRVIMTEPKIILKNESCFDLLKNINSNSVDLVLIDPPYEVSRDTNFQSGEAKGKDTDRFRVSMDFGDWDSGFNGLDIVIKESYRILKNGGTLICFYDLWKLTILKEYFDNAKFKQIRFIEWVKTNPVPLNSQTNYLTNAREVAVLGVKKGKPTFHSKYDSGIYEYPICHDKGRFHPTQKPLALIEALISKHSNKGDTVVDCFCGSGTTAVASYNQGRNFIGCELSKEYYDKSLLRLCDCRIPNEGTDI